MIVTLPRWVLLICLARWASADAALSQVKSDSGMVQATQRYARSLEMLTSDSGAGRDSVAWIVGRPSPIEAASFLQAEAFYLYRPDMRTPGTLSMAAQAVAASTDFTPLIIWTASTDVNGLRMQGYDGAVRLFEAFLSRFPEGPLAPLALFRLGWAYRGVSLNIFPRNSEKCVQELKEKFPSSPLTTLAGEMERTPFKLQTKAVAWSILPGAGQFYVGKPAAGLARMAVAAAFAALALIPPAYMIRDRELDWKGVALSAAGFVGLQVSYTFAFQDAQRKAIQFNEVQERKFLAGHPGTP